MNPGTLISSGIILLAIIAVAWGGTFLVRVTTGRHEVNELQRSFFRAGHAHAGILIILGLVIRLTLAGTAAPAWATLLADFVLYAALIMPAGFFLSVLGKNPERPNALRFLIWLGAVVLVIGLAGAGIGLIIAGVEA